MSVFSGSPAAVASWELGAVANATISVAYLAIAGIIFLGLSRTRQVRTNPLALATGVIFFSCGIGHGLHGLHLLLPMRTDSGMGGMRAGWTWELSIWDAVTAGVAVTYLMLRRRFGQLLRTPAMFRDEVERARDRELGDVLASLPEAVVVLGSGDAVEHANPAARELGMLQTLSAGVIADVVAVTRSEGTATHGVEVEVEVGGAARWLRLGTSPLHPDELGPHRVVLSLTDITEAHVAREALRASEAHHRSIIAALDEGVIVQALDGTVTACNPRAEQILGIKSHELRARLSDGASPVVREDGTPWPRHEHPIPRALASGEAVGPEIMGITGPDGERCWLEITATPLRDTGGSVHAAVASFVDVGVRLAAERALRASEGRLRTTLEGLTEGVVFYDAQLTMLAVNTAASAILGLPAEQVVGGAMGASQLVVLDADGEALPREEWPVSVAHRTGRTSQGRTLGLSYPGRQTRWIEAHAAPVGVAVDGRWPVVTSITDITERVVRDRELKQARQRAEAMFSSAPLGMKVTTLDGRISEANGAFADLLGYPVAEIVGRDGADFTHPEDVADQRAGEQQLLAGTAETQRMEKRLLHAAGHVVWVQLDSTVLRDADGAEIGFLSQIQDVSDRRRDEEQLRHLADRDPLTGLLNRRGFTIELERHVAQATRYGTSGALMMLDLDNFKQVNDTLGHKAGDELIVATADALRTRVRDSDILARLGGDEFAVLLPRGGTSEAVQAAQSILRLLRERRAAIPELRHHAVSASIGIAAVGDGTRSGDELLVNADLAMYDAKDAGRDQVAAYEEGHHEQPRTKARLGWMDRITTALEHDAFTLMSQPIQGLQIGGVPMHELLLRMNGHDGDLIPPATFLYIAERFDLIQAIDRWVVDAACDLLGRQAGGGPALAINVSAKSLNGPAHLVDHIERAIERHAFEPSQLVVEVTETAAVSQMSDARTFAQDLKALGCRLAIDDFGAGFGSLHHLKHLPFDYLKIDGEFVTGAQTSRADAVIVRALRDMAHGLGREVIAEHCTDQASEDYLRAEGIDFAQGYYLGRPAPAEDQLVLA